MGQVGHGDLHVAVSEIDADHCFGRVAQGQLDRRPPAVHATWIGLADLNLPDQSGTLQLGHQLGNRRSREPGDPGDVGLAGATLLTERSDHPLAVALSKPCQRAVTLVGHLPQHES